MACRMFEAKSIGGNNADSLSVGRLLETKYSQNTIILIQENVLKMCPAKTVFV